MHDRTLFLIATEWRGMAHMPEVARARTGQVLIVEAPAPGAAFAIPAREELPARLDANRALN